MHSPERALVVPLLLAFVGWFGAPRAQAQVEAWPPTGIPSSSIAEVPLADLRINGALRGSVGFLVDGEGRPLIKASLLRAELGDSIRPSILNSLASWDRYVAPDELSAWGIMVSYDPSTLILDINVQPRAFKILDIAPTRAARADPSGQSYAPEPVALMLGSTLSASPTFLADGSSPTVTGSIGFAPSLYLLGFVAQADAEVSYDKALGAEIADVLVFRNFPTLGARVVGGMIAARVTSFQSSAKLAGVSFMRERSLPGGKGAAEPILEELVLERGAMVAVSVNDIVVSRSRLAPGSYKISDLTLTSGMNEVAVRIEEEGQEPRVLSFGVPFDSSILKPGELDYAVSLGVDQATLAEALATGYLTAGISRALQLGIDAQARESSVLGGLSAVLASPLGNIGAAGAIAHDFRPAAAPKAAYAARLSWRLTVPGSEYLPRLGAGLEYKSAGFAAPLDATSADTLPDASSVSISGQIGETIPGSGISLTVFGDAQLSGSEWARSSLTAGITFPLPYSVSASVTAGLDWAPDKGFSPRASIAASVTPPDRRSMNFRHDLVTRDTSLGASLQLDKNGKESLSLNASMPDGSDSPQTANVSYRKLFPAFDLRFAGDYVGSQYAGETRVGLDIAASTSFMATGKGIVMANPSGNAFALVNTPPALAGQRIEVRSNSGPTIVGAAGRPILVAGLKPYAPFIASIDLPDAPPDVRIRPTTVRIVPDYGSVTVVNVRQASTTIVSGTVVDEAGKPMRELTGDRYDATGERVPFSGIFTDERGFFECYGLEPGRHEIRWSDGRALTIEIDEGEQRSSVELGVVVASFPDETEDQP